MKPASLAEWLEYIERIHPKTIELGLDRVREVKQRLGLSFSGPVITVGGTNGKGSCCAMAESILGCAGHRVGFYTSPHLLRYNERVRLCGKPADDARLCDAFARVEAARKSVQLTYFEFGTLAAWTIFCETPLDALVLEVGMGGRLDAVNAVDTDCAILTSVGLDHTEYLGATREQIGREKAGIFRHARPAIVVDPEPPRSVIEHAQAIGADLQCYGRDFGLAAGAGQWSFWGRGGDRAGLALPRLKGPAQLRNAAGCLAGLDGLAGRLPFGTTEVCSGLAQVDWPGRFQVLGGRPTVVLDVAHNLQAAETLASNLLDMGRFPETHAVVGMLRDKDITGVCGALRGQVTKWYPASLGGARGADSGSLARAIRFVDAAAGVREYDSPRLAYAAARACANGDDRIVVFGSFYTVADVMAAQAAAPGA